MPLPSDLISEFVEVTAEHVDVKSDGSTVYGTIVVQNEVKYVQLDGSDILTPIDSTTESLDGDRVMVLIKNHTATVTGNISNNSASVGTTTQITNDLIETNTVLAENILATNGRFENLSATYAKIETLEAEYAKIETLESDYAKISILEAGYATIENLNAANANIEKLDTEKLSADEADIKYAKIESLDATYANIDFANIGEAALNKIFAESGLIKDITIGDSTITGELVGVTIKGDLIVANTLKADKLVVKGEDGLYYKLNFESGNFSGSDVVPDDSLHGSVITANSITAEKISVKDLVAFDATIGGFIIDNDSIHSSVKATVDNTTRGIYMDNDGQFAIGDAANYLKYFKDTDGTYKLDISAASLKFGTSDKNIIDAIDELENSLTTVDNKIDDLEIGGRNLIRSSRDFALDETNVNGWSTWGEWTFTQDDDVTAASIAASGLDYANVYSLFSSRTSAAVGDTYTFSCWIKLDDRYAWDVWIPCIFEEYDSSGNRVAWYDMAQWDANCNQPTVVSGEWFYFCASYTTTNPSIASIGVRIILYQNGSIHFKKCKLEKGNKPTDWSPAPEDHDYAAENAQEYLRDKVMNIETSVAILADSISNLVRGADGESLMTQTSDGWMFNISSIQSDLKSVIDDVGVLNTDVGNTNELVDNLNSALESATTELNKYTDYIKFGTENGQPCIILGETDSDFKVVITNTDIRFMEGSITPAYINNQSLHVSKAVISDELKQGGFAWMARANGNYGLLWRGE